MLTFFRRIRKGLLGEGATSKYLLYAIGEIMLVVIGILIALGINNWNENRIQHHELHDYLLKIAENMKEDFVVALDYKLRRDSLAHASQLAVKTIDENEMDFDVLKTAAACFVEFYFIANKSGFEALKNSGYIGKIKNYRISQLLHEYYAIVGQIEKEEGGYNAFIENMEVDFNLKFPAIEFKKYVYTDDFKLAVGRIPPDSVIQYFRSEAYQAAFARTAQQNYTQTLYQELIEVGQSFVDELNDHSK